MRMRFFKIGLRSQQIGIELGARTLKVAWVIRGPGAKQCWQFRQQPRSDDHDPTALTRHLTQLLRPLHHSRFDAHVIVTAPESYLHRLTVCVPEARQIPHALEERLPSLLPFDVEHAQVQYYVHHQQSVDGGLEADLMVAACDRAALLRDIDACWRIGWVSTAVVPAALALVEAARALHVVGPAPHVLMEIGECCTTIVLLHEGEVVCARDVALGDEQLTEALMRQISVGERTLSLSREQAVALKQRIGIPLGAVSMPPTNSPIPLSTYLAMIQPVLEQLVSELRRTMTFGAQPGAAAAPPPVLISGEGARLPHCDEWLAQQLGVAVTRLSCESMVGVEGAASAVVCGLTLLPRALALDLQPRPYRHRGTLVRIASRGWRACLLMAIILWCGAALWMLRTEVMARQWHVLQDRWQHLEPVVAMQEAVAQQMQLTQRLVEREGLTSEWFRRLAHDFPGAVRLTQLSIDGQHHVRLVGEAQERDQNPEATVSQLAMWLEQAKVCQAVHLESTRRLSAGGNLVVFTMTCRVP